MQNVTVTTNTTSYQIHIDASLNKQELLAPYITGKQVMVVTNTTVAPLYLEELKKACSSASDFASVVLEDGEQYKNMASMEQAFDALMQNYYNRDCVIIALGGGVIGDMAGFTAASFQRGVDMIQIPTTLLSQVDSSVGGKTGINHPMGKNMIGAFKQPKQVLIETNSLKTLPPREVSAGIAEIIKYALINDYEFFEWLEQNMAKLVALDEYVVAEAIQRSCQHKANIVAEDEFEAGRRALLNLGHTFGHAIENYMGYGEWLHGEAVSVGMLQAAVMSCKMGLISQDDVTRTKKLLQAANLPVVPADIPVADALQIMQRDKKVKSGKVRLVLLQQIGKAFITNDFEQQTLEEVLALTELA